MPDRDNKLFDSHLTEFNRREYLKRTKFLVEAGIEAGILSQRGCAISILLDIWALGFSLKSVSESQ